MKHKGIFIAATGQNVGKTTTCLGVISGLQKRFQKVGFIKPVGQRHVKVNGGLHVDKDVVLFKEHFNLPFSYEDMSPVILPSGFTRDYLDNKISNDHLREKIKSSFTTISATSDYIIVEGTGHSGVGSIIDLNNADVAAKLGLEVIIIAPGGLGSAIDELALNKLMFESKGARVRGIILNRVIEDKLDMIREYIPKVLKKWGIPLIGCIPYNALLSNPSMQDFSALFDTPLLSGEEYRYLHFGDTRLVSGSVETLEEVMIPNQLVITTATREDIIFAVANEPWNERLAHENGQHKCGVILTGRHPPSDKAIEALKRAQIPSLYAAVPSYQAMTSISSFIAKIRNEDTSKVTQAINLVESNLDFDALCN